MTSTSKIVALRLRTGGVLVVAPVSSLPWPAVLGRKLRRLQERGVAVARADPHAMARLRDELPRMLNQPVTRGAAAADMQTLADTVLQAARSGHLTLLYGHAETSLRDGLAGELAERFGVPGAADIPDPAQGTPPPTTPTPRERVDRMHWACVRAPSHLRPPNDRVMLEFFSKEAGATTAELLTLWSETLESNAGFTVDAGMFATAVWRLGSDAPLAFAELANAFALVRSAVDWPTLDQAAASLAAGSEGLTAPLFRQFLRRVGDRRGAGGQSMGGETDGSTGASAPT